MSDPHASPISQLLHSMGMTREDLSKHSNEMRQFLTANDPHTTRVADLSSVYSRSRSSSDLRSTTRSSSSSFSMARSLSRASSNSMRDTSPPATPVKTEHPDSGPILHRPMDNMEIIIERQRQSRKERKSRRGRERAAASKPYAPGSPSPSSTSQPTVNLDRFMYSRDEPSQVAEDSASRPASTSSEALAPPPQTPQKNKYYREHTMDGTNSQTRKDTPCKAETPTPTRTLSQQTLPPPPLYAYSLHMAAYPHYLSASQEQLPVTPQKPQLLQHGNTPTPTQKSIAKMPSPLPPSSPFHAQSSPPPSSPCPPRVLHQVSSPGPMEPLPTEEEYDKLPYKLPPGPYSPSKPDLSYAALVGQAIISSPEHRLTLQEIYDWITIVYPHYKRGETTWMNSIRHVLSTTACFRKVPRDRSIGRTLWAIFDEDLECFKGGGFRKHLCKDIMNQQKEKAKKTNSRKRSDADEGSSTEPRKSKKARKESYAPPARPAPAQTSAPVHVMVGPQPTFRAAHPYFPRPTQHQPYYESCMPQSQPQVLPAEIIFPPLPPDAALRSARIIQAARPVLRSSSPAPSSPPASIAQTSSESSVVSSSGQSTSSMASVPELTPNRSSSTTPPSSVPATSDMDADFLDDDGAQNRKAARRGGSDVAIAGDDDVPGDRSMALDDDSVFNSSVLGPVQYWGESPRSAALLAPGIELLNYDAMSDDDGDYVLKKDTKGKEKAGGRRGSLYPSAPSSPTPAARSKADSQAPPMLKASSIERPKTPTRSSNAAASSSTLPSTPPRNSQLSSTRTPISHKGLTMSPSASLAHYKCNLDPPPVLFQSGANKLLSSLALEADGEHDLLRTPRRASGSGSGLGGSLSSGPPVTPKKLGLFDSPLRTGLSPFRTPGSVSRIFDPHDPRVLLDDELNRAHLGDSPMGIFGKRSSLLYDSPASNLWSPGKSWYY